MSLLSLINDTFPKNREPDGGLFVRTRRGDVFAGSITQCDNRGMVLETASGVVLLIPRAIVAISDNRSAIEPDPA